MDLMGSYTMMTLNDKRCGSCGHDLSGDEHFCDMCGTPCIAGETPRIPDLIGLAEALDADDELRDRHRRSTAHLGAARGPPRPKRTKSVLR